MFGDRGVGELPKQTDQADSELVERISGYVEPSKDETLEKKSQEQKCKYFSSTSSISSPLIALYFLFSNFRVPETTNIYEGFLNKPMGWMISYRKPTTFYLYPKGDNTCAIVSDKGLLPMSNQVLLNLGHVMEFFLTKKKEETEQLMRG